LSGRADEHQGEQVRKSRPDATTTDAPDGRAGITAALVRRLVADQFPAWAGLAVVPVPDDGWDNRTYRLGRSLTVRLPTHQRYVAAVAKEDRWLPVLGPRLPLPVPVPVATGRPADGYPHPWSVRRWIEGRPVERHRVTDPTAFARDLAGFLRALRSVEPRGGPEAGAHSFYRGCPPAHYDSQTRAALQTLGHEVDRPGLEAVWQDALSSTWTGPGVWFHGDIASGNLLLDEAGGLSAVLDFGTSGVGDPACDLVIAFTFLRGRSRATFREAMRLEDDAWARARGWAAWKALIMLAQPGGASAQAEHREVLDAVLADRAADH
jgi:aminoglycoside phosphotransferase (APT) family kinase protein